MGGGGPVARQVSPEQEGTGCTGSESTSGAAQEPRCSGPKCARFPPGTGPRRGTASGGSKGPWVGDPTRPGKGKRAVCSECSKPLESRIRASGWGGGVATAKLSVAGLQKALKHVSHSESAGSGDP